MGYRYLVFHRYAVLISAFILFLGWILFIYPAYQTLHHLQEKEHQFSKQSQSEPRLQKKMLKQNTQYRPFFKEKDLALSTLTHLYALFSQVEMSSILIHFLGIKNNIVRYHLEITCDAANMQKIMHLLFHGDYPILLFNQAFRTLDNKRIQLSTDLWAVNVYRNTHALIKTRLPFCTEAGAASFDEDTSLLSKMSLEQIKMRGYLKQGRLKKAIILLPNRTYLTVTAGNEISKEKAIITEIRSDGFIVRLGNQVRREFKLPSDE